MNKLLIKSIHSPDADRVWEWNPDDKKMVSCLLEFSIGDTADDGADLFQVYVITLGKFIDISKGKSGILIDRGAIIVAEWNWEIIIDHVTKILAKSSCDTWPESANKLQRYFRWEYEDYTVSE